MDRNSFRLPLLAQLGKLLLKGFAFLLEATLDLYQLSCSLGPRLLSSLLNRLFPRDLLLERADLFGRPTIFLIGLLQPSTHRLEFGFQLRGGLCLRLLAGLTGLLFLRHPLLQRADLLRRPVIFLVGLLQPSTHRLEFGFQLRGGLCLRLLAGLTGLLFLRHPLLQRADLLRRPVIFLVGLLQPSTHRLEFSLQAKEVLCCFIRRGAVGVLFLA